MSLTAVVHRLRAGTALLLLAAVVAGCSLLEHSRPASTTLSDEQLAADPPIVVPPAPVAPEVWGRRGDIVAQQPFTDLTEDLRDATEAPMRATYRSVSAATGAQTEVSGSFFLPKGEPPQGGWPVVALAHGTTGLGTDCDLSSRQDLFGYWGAVKAVLSVGYAVALSDYEGLGLPGRHPYLEPKTAAFNTVDAVRAMRRLYPSVSTRWLAYGISQGGQAAWATAELNGTYGDGLELVGAVALSPAADIVGLSELAYEKRLSQEQLMVTPMVIDGLSRYDPSISIATYVRGAALQRLPKLVGCNPEANRLRGETIRPTDVGPTTTVEANVLTDALRRIALPQRPLTVPMLVLNGLRDQTILPDWVTLAVARSCRLGGIIEHREDPNAGHADLMPGPAVAEWVTDRFAGKTPQSTCPGAT
ncbi:lipase family protein [Mycobacterium sp. MYCO198283]|uniref:lipase family protein n=1 Tax=Mycobacterium sp. MYCO198283 TaxID=2883505 RepID=UPI001E2F8600|nr:lipase family protein [Mycobacterium sp. MYCO198283]MCG5431651.1 lipase family protein [Mycobacterium sp. MYCO198283]